MVMGGGGPKDDADDFTSDIIGVDSYSFSTPSKKAFLPWHKPRKQFVRHDQWRYYINQLVTEHKVSEGRLTYFGLPGVDLLDIRYFGTTICEPHDIKLRFLGFDKGAAPESEFQSEFNISYDEVSKTPSFDPQSEIIAFDLRELVDDESIAWQKTLEFGPYDVINLDLCDGVANEPSGEDSRTYYNAMSKLLTIQARRKTPWLLFLTTRVGQNYIHDETLKTFSGLYETNLRDCKSFQKISEQKLAIGDEKALQAALNASRGLQSVVLVGLCKWLLGLVLGQVPPTIMEVKNIFGYRVNEGAEAEDMVSIALRFDPTHDPLPDPTKLAASSATKPDECELASKAAKRVSGLIDVDAYLASQKSVKDEMIEAMCSLLESARYDVDLYRKEFAV